MGKIEDILASCLQSDLQVDLTVASKKLAIDFDQKFQVLSQRIRKQRKIIEDLKRQLRLEQATKYSINQ